uniref:Uncharacterized protein n=1 Tax=Romanomermis culicivorax TaxID=13658 RepID=A0A915IUH1_ROMCU
SSCELIICGRNARHIHNTGQQLAFRLKFQCNDDHGIQDLINKIQQTNQNLEGHRQQVPSFEQYFNDQCNTNDQVVPS